MATAGVAGPAEEEAAAGQEAEAPEAAAGKEAEASVEAWGQADQELPPAGQEVGHLVEQETAAAVPPAEQEETGAAVGLAPRQGADPWRTSLFLQDEWSTSRETWPLTGPQPPPQ